MMVEPVDIIIVTSIGDVNCMSIYGSGLLSVVHHVKTELYILVARAPIEFTLDEA